MKKLATMIAMAAVVLATAVAGFSSAFAAEECLEETPLPSHIRVHPPADNVGEGAAQFLGVWSEGKWNGLRCHTLVVSKVNADGTASVIYSYGEDAIHPAGYVRRRAKIKNSELSFRLPWKAEVSYELARSERDALKGEYSHSYSGKWTVTLTKMKGY